MSDNTITVANSNTSISVSSDGDGSITILEGANAITVSSQGIQGPKGEKGEKGDSSTVDATDMQVLGIASKAGGAFTYISGALDLITYADNDGITSHTKQLTYTTGKLTQTTEIFTYESQVWTVVIDFTYTGDTLTAKTNPIIVKA